MTKWSVIVGDILDVAADVLVCSANPFLSLSGGVGGAFLRRYGSAMQDELQAHLDELGVRHVPPGTVLKMPPCGSPCESVLHAVAVNSMYESTSQLITRVAERVFECAEQVGGQHLALPALATGYGKLTREQFAVGLQPLVSRRTDVALVTVCVRHQEYADTIRGVMALEEKRT